MIIQTVISNVDQLSSLSTHAAEIISGIICLWPIYREMCVPMNALAKGDSNHYVPAFVPDDGSSFRIESD